MQGRKGRNLGRQANQLGDCREYQWMSGQAVFWNSNKGRAA